jgi:hypothetical protein
VALLSPAAARRCNAWQWLIVAFSAMQKQQLDHQQLTNGSTILKMFTTFPVNLNLFKAYGYFVLLAVCSAIICSAKFGFFLPGRTLNG